MSGKDEVKRLKDEGGATGRLDDVARMATEFAEQARMRFWSTRRATLLLGCAAAEAARRETLAGRIVENAEWTARHDADAAEELIAAWSESNDTRVETARSIFWRMASDFDLDLEEDLHDPHTAQELSAYESAAQGAWADAEFVATGFREEFPAPDSDAFDAGALADVRTLAALLSAAREIVERRMMENANAARKAATVGKAVAK